MNAATDRVNALSIPKPPMNARFLICMCSRIGGHAKNSQNQSGPGVPGQTSNQDQEEDQTLAYQTVLCREKHVTVKSDPVFLNQDSPHEPRTSFNNDKGSAAWEAGFG
jgi:hypothetical protein